MRKQEPLILPKNPASLRYFPYVTRQEQPRPFQHNFIRYSLLYLSFFDCLDDFVTRITARQKAFYSVFKQEEQCTSRDGETPDSRYKEKKRKQIPQLHCRLPMQHNYREMQGNCRDTMKEKKNQKRHAFPAASNSAGRHSQVKQQRQKNGIDLSQVAPVISS